MVKSLSWKAEAETLRLRGELDLETLIPLWKQRKITMVGIRYVDVSGLTRVDSAGIALMLHLCELRRTQGNTLTFVGISNRLNTLIILYQLENILPCGDTILSS